MDTIKLEHISGKTILVIEDNDGDFFLVEDLLLENLKHATIVQGKNMAYSVSYLEKYPTEVAIILLDLHLPDGRGIELVKTILQNSNNIPIVILSGYTDLNIAKQSLNLGVSDYLVKDELNAEILYKALLYAKERYSYVGLLQRSTRMYQELFDFSPQPMWVFSPETLAFLNVNKAAMTKYGYTFEEFMGMTLKDINPTEHWETLVERLNGTKGNEYSPCAGVFVHILKSGEHIQVEIFSNAITFQGSQARLVLANDVTEKYNYIQTIEKQNRRLRDIAWTQSHVVRAPLSRILGIINLLKIEEEYSQELKFLLEQIKNSGMEMDTIIQDIVKKTAEIEMNGGKRD